MKEQWNKDAELKHFADIWQGRPALNKEHTAKLWDERAHEWAKELKENETRKQRSENRVSATAAFLRAHNLLASDQCVIDIGCGPGRFVVEFAKSSKSALGVDLSHNMAEYGRLAALEAGTTNAEFCACDFRSVDIDSMKWRKQFDLAFLSITPALQTIEDLDRVEAVSRAFCFHSSFVRAYDSVAQEVLHAVLPNVAHDSFWNGRLFYSLFNILWLRGRYPEATYYKESSVERVAADRSTVQRIVERVPAEALTAEVVEKLYRYLNQRADRDGYLEYPSERWYGWLLWDVRDNAVRCY